jgi:hypothetical protein
MNDRIPGDTSILGRRSELWIDGETSEEELALQIFVTFSGWGLGEATESDFKTLTHYVRKIVPSAGEPLARGVASGVLTNWLDPESARHFNAYIKRTAWGLRVQDRAYTSPQQENLDSEQYGLTHGKRSLRPRNRPSDFVSVRDLAARSSTSVRRIYELINDGKLPAKRRGYSLAVERSAAEELICKGQIQQLRTHLESLGRSKEALRKRIYRLRRNGRSETQIIGCLRKLLLPPTD